MKRECGCGWTGGWGWRSLIIAEGGGTWHDVFTYALRVASWNVALHLGFARRIKKYNTKLECGYNFVK